MNNDNNNQSLNNLYGNPSPTPSQNPQPAAPANSAQNMNELYGNPAPTPQPEVQPQPVMQPQAPVDNQVPHQTQQPQMTPQPEVPPVQNSSVDNPNSGMLRPSQLDNSGVPNSSPTGNINNNSNTQPVDDDKYVKAFVGLNYQDFIDGSFNVGAFFLTSLYFYYRKMFLYGLAFFIGQIGLSLLLGKLYIGIIVNLACGFLANKIYLNFARSKVKKLSNNFSEDELLRKCEDKGGTSVGLVFLGMFIEFIAVIIVVFILMFTVGIALFGSLMGAANDSLEQQKYKTMADNLKVYSNAVQTSTIANEIICNNKKIATLNNGVYYIEVDSSEGNSIAQKNSKELVYAGGKSAWDDADVKGYIKIEKTGNRYSYAINMSDNTHGTKEEVSSLLISENDISDNVPFPTTPNGIKCSVGN